MNDDILLILGFFAVMLGMFVLGLVVGHYT